MTITLVPSDIEKYAQEHTEVPGPLFEELRQSTSAQMPSAHMQVGRLEGTFLQMLVRMTQARRVLEIGTSRAEDFASPGSGFGDLEGVAGSVRKR